MPPTDHVRTLRDYAKRSIAYGFEEHFDPDDADDIADYIEKLEATVNDLARHLLVVTEESWPFIHQYSDRASVKENWRKARAALKSLTGDGVTGEER